MGLREGSIQSNPLSPPRLCASSSLPPSRFSPGAPRSQPRAAVLTDGSSPPARLPPATAATPPPPKIASMGFVLADDSAGFSRTIVLPFAIFGILWLSSHHSGYPTSLKHISLWFGSWAADLIGGRDRLQFVLAPSVWLIGGSPIGQLLV